jgi:hypothetical protein
MRKQNEIDRKDLAKGILTKKGERGKKKNKNVTWQSTCKKYRQLRKTVDEEIEREEK